MKENLKQPLLLLKIIHGAMIAGPIIFLLIVSTTLTNPKEPKIEDMFNLLKYAVPTITILAIVAANVISKSLLKNLENKTIVQKLGVYQTYLIYKMAIFEAAILFSIIAALLANAHVFFSAVLVLLVLMFLNRPTVANITKVLGLRASEQTELDNIN